MITKEQFEELAGIKLVEVDGKLFFGGILDLENKNIQELPDNLFIYRDLNLRNSGVTKLPKGLEVGGTLNISGTEIEELPEDTKFGDGLYINDMKKPFSFPKVVKKVQFFECKSTIIKHMPEEIYVKWKCDFSYSTFDKLPKVIEVGFELSCKGSSLTEFPDIKKEIYCYINLSKSNITKLPKHFTVYRNLMLSDTPIKELPKGLIVGVVLDLRNANLKDYSNLHKVCTKFIVNGRKYDEIKNTLTKHSIERFFDIRDTTVYITFEPNYKGAYLFENENGRYIKADGIFGKIIEQKGNVYYVKLGKSEEISYLVTDGNSRWVHDYTLDKAKDELLFKINKRNKDDYKDLTLDSELSFEDAIMCYRVITDASKHINSVFDKNKKDRYTIKEIIKITKDEYGGRIFKDFFRKKRH